MGYKNIKNIQILSVGNDGRLKMAVHCIWKLNNMLINNPWVRIDVPREMKLYLELNENKSATYQHWWDVIKAAFRGIFIALKCSY